VLPLDDELSGADWLEASMEQDHRGVQWVTRPMLGFTSFAAAQDTLVGIELMHMIKSPSQG
jgi:putative transposase